MDLNVFNCHRFYGRFLIKYLKKNANKNMQIICKKIQHVPFVNFFLKLETKKKKNFFKKNSKINSERNFTAKLVE